MGRQEGLLWIRGGGLDTLLGLHGEQEVQTKS